MNRLQRDVVILALLKELKLRGSWCGETHLQKSVYFLQELLRVPLGFEFVLYKHGPHSFDLSDEFTASRADLMVEVKLNPPYGPSLLPTSRSQALIQRSIEHLKRTKNQSALSLIGWQLRTWPSLKSSVRLCTSQFLSPRTMWIPELREFKN